ncbi:6-acetamido-3-oxohexanoate:acetyl-CoA CoA transferase alpha subunit [Bacillus sp. OV322]|uniref:CoA transferase subunit A n=1 Tax=Bacillus sp. OV322 TaxID=1882764 RepID=UPI0008E6D8AE|nr:CoA transferase subunit A [Bacillus sp. OV322]SFC76657.1 6-acetamido-3-oxohexanoate:acetyl-CoA CoA transferase alpha subunit [Bacillus sp. OV322]
MSNFYSKICSMEDIKHVFKDGMTILFGGFGGVGTPPGLIDLILQSGVKNLTVIGNDAGFPDIGIGRAVTARRVKKMIVSHIGSNPNAGGFMTSGEMEIEFSPQGTLAERIRAGGMGLGGILTDIGLEDDFVKRDKGVVTVDSKRYLVEPAITADVAIVYAEKSDPYGNLVYDKSARNNNPLVAMAGSRTIAEVREIVPLGSLDPEEIVSPGVFIDHIIESKGVTWKWAWEKI